MWLWLLVGAIALPVLACLYMEIKHIMIRRQITIVPQRHVLITGCDTGFGNLLTRKLDSLGVPVFAACLTTKGADELASETSSGVQTLLLDVTDKASIDKAVDFVTSRLPPNTGLWGLVNNAGILQSMAPFEMSTIEEFDALLRVNMHGTRRVSYAFLPHVRQAGGRVLNVCSVMNNFAYPGVTTYCVSKAAVHSFTTCFREEVRPSGVTVVSMEPGGFRTGFTTTERMRATYKRVHERSSEDVKEFYGGKMASFFWRGFGYLQFFLSSRQHLVVDAMTHALFARCPQETYLVGYDAAVLFPILNLLPEWAVDGILGFPQPYGDREVERRGWPEVM